MVACEASESEATTTAWHARRHHSADVGEMGAKASESGIQFRALGIARFPF
jgi:hypothetical protein